MAKSKSKPKGKSKKPAPKKKVAKKVTKPRPKQQRLLDDMPKVKRLDDLCETIADVQSQINTLLDDQKSLKQDSLREMQKNNVTIYRAHGVQMVRTQGDEKLSVKLLKDDNGAADNGTGNSASDPADGEDAGDDSGEGDGE